MSAQDKIYVPNRPSDMPELLVSSDLLNADFAMESSAEFTETWNLYSKSHATDDIALWAPYLLSSWLLKSRGLATANVLASPYALLEVTKENEGITSDQADLTSIYGFRLVNLVESTETKDGPVELIEHKLLAGRYTFQRKSDESVFLGIAVALRSFRLGKLEINDYKGWEAHFA